LEKLFFSRKVKKKLTSGFAPLSENRQKAENPKNSRTKRISIFVYGDATTIKGQC
jgi:hypothetical protein